CGVGVHWSAGPLPPGARRSQVRFSKPKSSRGVGGRGMAMESRPLSPSARVASPATTGTKRSATRASIFIGANWSWSDSFSTSRRTLTGVPAGVALRPMNSARPVAAWDDATAGAAVAVAAAGAAARSPGHWHGGGHSSEVSGAAAAAPESRPRAPARGAQARAGAGEWPEGDGERDEGLDDRTAGAIGLALVAEGAAVLRDDEGRARAFAK